MTRARYVKFTMAQVQVIEDWYKARRALGNEKQMAARMGVESHRIQRVIAKMRDRIVKR